MQRFADIIAGLNGSVVTVDNAEWDKRYDVLKHTFRTLVQMSAAHDEEFSNVDFKIIAFDTIGTLKQWARVSVQGRVHEIQEPMASDRKVGQSVVDFFLRNMRGQGVRVKLVANSEDLPTFNVGDELLLRNIKVNDSGEQLYADLEDMTEGQSLGATTLGVSSRFDGHHHLAPAATFASTRLLRRNASDHAFSFFMQMTASSGGRRVLTLPSQELMALVSFKRNRALCWCGMDFEYW